MSRDFPFSPTALEEYRSNPLKKITDKFFLRKSNALNIQGYSPSKVGTEIHAYIEDAFKFMESKKSSLTYNNPSDKYIQSIIFDAQERAKSALSLKTSMHMRDGANNIIKNYGERFLKDINENIFIEHHMTGEVAGARGKHHINGIADLIMVNAKKKHAEIIDVKNILSNNIVDAFENADKNLQTKSYSFMFIQEMKNKGMDLDTIKFTFAKNMASGEVAFSSFDFTSKQVLGKMQNDLAVEISKAEAINAMSYGILSETKDPRKALQKIYQQVLYHHGGCNPGYKCNTCIMRYSCSIKLSAGIKDKVKRPDSISGHTEDIDIVNKLRKAEKEAFTKFDAAVSADMGGSTYEIEKRGSDFYDKRADSISKGIYASRRKQLLEMGLPTSSDTFSILNNEIDILNESQQTLKKFKRGQFEDSILKGGLETKTRLPYPILSSANDASNPLFSAKLSKNISILSNEILSEIFEDLEINRPTLQKKLIDDMYSDSRFVSKLLPLIEDNAAKTLKERGMDTTYKNIHKVLSSAQHIISDEVINHIELGLNERVVDHLHKYNQDKLYSNINPRYRSEHSQQKAVFGDKPVNPSRKDIRKLVSQFDSGFSLSEKFSLSIPKGTLGTITKAMILTQLAGNQTIYNLLRNKMDKTAEFIENKDKPIDTGEHYSTYTAMRRLMLSDFGSSTRKFTPISSIYSLVSAKGSSMLNKVKKAYSEFWTSHASGKYDTSFLANSDLLKYGGISAGVAFTYMSIVPRTLSGSEQREYNYQKKQSLKEDPNVNNTTDSYYQTPSSELRAKYKLHTDFGSPVFLNKIAKLMFQKIDISEIINWVKKLGTVSAGKSYDHYKHSLRNIISKSSAMDVAEELSSEVADDTKSFFLRKMKGIREEVASGLENTITYAKNRVYSKHRLGEVQKASGSNQTNLANYKAQDKLNSAIGELVEKRPKIKKNPYPIIKEHEKRNIPNIFLKTSSRSNVPEIDISFEKRIANDEVRYPRLIRKPKVKIPDNVMSKLKDMEIIDQSMVLSTIGIAIPERPILTPFHNTRIPQYTHPVDTPHRNTTGQNYIPPGLYDPVQLNNLGDQLNRSTMNPRKNYRYGAMFSDLNGFIL